MRGRVAGILLRVKTHLRACQERAHCSSDRCTNSNLADGVEYKLACMVRISIVSFIVMVLDLLTLTVLNVELYYIPSKPYAHADLNCQMSHREAIQEVN